MEQNQKPIQVVKVTLPTSRVAIVRCPKISDNELAAKMTGQRKNNFEMALAMQKNLVSLLLLEIDGEKVDHTKKSDLDDLLSISEYNVLVKVVSKLSGGDEMGEEPAMEMEMILK